MWGRLSVLTLFLSVLSSDFPLRAEGQPIFAPQPVTRPHQRSVEVPLRWDEFIRFEMNRGPDAVNYQEEILDLLQASRIQSLEAFTSFKNTRISLSSFEVRSREVVDALETLLEQGVSVRIVLDAAYIYPIEMPTEEEWESWGPRQRAYFVKSYDKGEDGEVTPADLARVNGERRLSTGTWERLTELQKKYSKQVELIHPPREVVPERENFNYPRIHHMKVLSFQFRKTSRSPWQDPSYAWVTSANFTEASLHRRVSNVTAYLRGEDPVYDSQSQGHIEFGASFHAQDSSSQRAIQVLTGHLEKWIEAYKSGKSFDSVPPGSFQEPRVAFADGSTLQAFFSEGVQLEGKETIDPLWVISKILFRKDIQLITYYDTQFVFTHSRIARLLRSVLNFHKPERFAVMVDSSQALEPWSALPALIYAPLRRESYGVYPGRAIESYEGLSSELKWQENILVYRGGDVLRERNNDKLHLKARYFEYVDALGVTHYVLVWGSANSSHNASKLSADVHYLFQSTDPKVGETLRPYFEALRKNPRMQAYSTAYLERYLYENFYESKALRSSSYLQRWSRFLSARSQRQTLTTLVQTLKVAGASTQQGALMLRFFDWHLKYNGHISDFGWEDFELILHITQDQTRFSSDFLEEVVARWTTKVRNGTTQRGARQSLKNLLRPQLAPLPGSDVEKPSEPRGVAQASVYKNCRDFLAIVKGTQDFRRQRYPIVESKVRRKSKKD